MPVKPRFSRTQLQRAALALVDAQGLAALSMRSLAAALGTGAMTLYNYVADRRELEALLVDAVMQDVRMPTRPAADWRDEVRAIVEAVWRAARAHPHVVPLLLTRRSVSPAILDPTEALLRALSRSGRTGAELLVAFRTVTAFVMGIAQAEVAGPLSLAHGETAEEVVRRMHALPADRYPRLHEISGAAATSDAYHEFRAGLDIVLSGLAGSSRPRRR